MTVILDGSSLTLADVQAVARDGARVEVSPLALARMAEARGIVEEALERDEAVYGLNTGVGERKRVRLDPQQVDEFNRLLVLNHRVAQGEPAPPDVVRAALLCLANSYAKGTVGVRPDLTQVVVRALNEGFVPRVRRLGSVGVSDLGPMADLAHELLTHTGYRLAANEGLALLNSGAFATGWGALALVDCARLLDTIDVAGALDLEAFAANVSILHPVVAEARPYPGLRTARERLTTLLEGSYLWDRGAARNLQDPLSFRCLPQVQGAARDVMTYATRQVEIELNAAQGNPIVVVQERRLISVGNFDILPLAAAMDCARVALMPVLTSANERLMKLLQAPLSGMRSGLLAGPDLAEDGLAEFGVAGQALTVEARTLAYPVSYELVSSSQAEGIEDRTTMAPLSARRLAEMVALGERIAAVELVVAVQAIDVRAPAALGRGTRRAMQLVREVIPLTTPGAPIPQDLEPVCALIRSGTWAALLAGSSAGVDKPDTPHAGATYNV